MNLRDCCLGGDEGSEVDGEEGLDLDSGREALVGECVGRRLDRVKAVEEIIFLLFSLANFLWLFFFSLKIILV